LLTESQVFEDEILSGTESTDHPAEDMPERHDHVKNLIGTLRVELLAKSLIFRVYDVLARRSGHEKSQKDRSVTLRTRSWCMAILCQTKGSSLRDAIAEPSGLNQPLSRPLQAVITGREAR
jgi:hypothetical protein